MNDHILNRIIRETIYKTQGQIIIMFYLEIEPVTEAAKCSCYTDVLTNDQALLPKLPTYSPLRSPERKNSLTPPHFTLNNARIYIHYINSQLLN